LFVVLFFCYALAVLVLDGPELRNFGQYAVATIGSASNILAWHKSGYFAAGAGQNPLLMTWSRR
jgi:peptidoglycan/LPS O-acetylase OafA/YrhL